MLSSGLLVAHNAVFDMGVLKRYLRDYRDRVETACTLSMYRANGKAHHSRNES